MTTVSLPDADMKRRDDRMRRAARDKGLTLRKNRGKSAVRAEYSLLWKPYQDELCEPGRDRARVVAEGGLAAIEEALAQWSAERFHEQFEQHEAEGREQGLKTFRAQVVAEVWVEARDEDHARVLLDNCLTVPGAEDVPEVDYIEEEPAE